MILGVMLLLLPLIFYYTQIFKGLLATFSISLEVLVHFPYSFHLLHSYIPGETRHVFRAWPLPQHVCGSLLEIPTSGKDLTLWFDILCILLRYLQEVDVRPRVGLEMGVEKFPLKAKLAFFFLFYTRPMKLLSSAAHPTLSCSASFLGVRVSLRKSLLLEAMTSYFYPLHLVCGLMGLCCYAGGEQWNSLDDDF